MTVGHLLFAAVTTAYIFVGIFAGGARPDRAVRRRIPPLPRARVDDRALAQIGLKRRRAIGRDALAAAPALCRRRLRSANLPAWQCWQKRPRPRGAIPRRSRRRCARSPRSSATALVTSQAVREQHGNTVTWIENQPPDAVVFPQSTEDVQEIVRICAAHRVPVIPFGTGTSLEGHVNAPLGGVSIDVRDMNQVLAVHAEDLDCVVAAGHHPQGAQRISARPGPVLPDRSRRRRLARRHGGDALLGHQRGALRHHEGQRAVAQSGDGERRADDHGAAGEEILRRLRPHAPDRRLGRHARRHHRADAEALRHSRRRSPAASVRFPRSRPAATPPS